MCHDLAPDTSDSKLFFKWVKKQSWVKRDDAKIKQALIDLEVDTSDEALLAKYTDLLKSKGFRKWCDRTIGLHGNQLPPYGVHYSSSTIIAALIAYYEEICK